MKIVILHTEDPDAEGALEDLFEQADEKLADARVAGGIVFSHINAEHQSLMSGLMGRFPGANFIGCSTDGEVSSDQRFTEDSIAVALFVSDDIQISIGYADNVSEDPAMAVTAAVRDARLDGAGEPALCIALPDCLLSDGAALVETLRGELGDEVPLAGGMAGDQWRFEQTRQFANDHIMSDGLPLMLFYGPLAVSLGTGSGFRPFGRSAVVTDCSGQVVRTIDNEPAVDFFRAHFGMATRPSPEYPLALSREADAPYVLRAPVAFDMETGAVTFAGALNIGDEVRLTTAVKDEVLAGCRDSVRMALDGFEGVPAGILLFSCAARKQLLGMDTSEEYNIAVDGMDADIPVAGFYSYGEVGPTPGGQAQFHNETVVTLVMGRAAA